MFEQFLQLRVRVHTYVNYLVCCRLSVHLVQLTLLCLLTLSHDCAATTQSDSLTPLFIVTWAAWSFYPGLGYQRSLVPVRAASVRATTNCTKKHGHTHSHTTLRVVGYVNKPNVMPKITCFGSRYSLSIARQQFSVQDCVLK